jgi:hypothetical protein
MMGEVMRGGGSRWRVAGWGLAGAVLLVPVLGMLLTGEMGWGPGDFLVAALLLGATGLAIEGVVRMVRPGAPRVAAAAAVVAGLLLVWAELAVGVFS